MHKEAPTVLVFPEYHLYRDHLYEPPSIFATGEPHVYHVDGFFTTHSQRLLHQFEELRTACLSLLRAEHIRPTDLIILQNKYAYHILGCVVHRHPF